MCKLNSACYRLGLTAKEKYLSLTGVEPMTFAGIGSDGIYQSCITDVLSEGELT